MMDKIRELRNENQRLTNEVKHTKSSMAYMWELLGDSDVKILVGVKSKTSVSMK